VSAERNQERFVPYFGGLFLFDQSIPTTSRYMPAGTKMVGNGSYKYSNSGVLTEMGSYNEIESHASQNSFTQVYDFSTQQANGVIGSVCLTTDVGGYVGYGFSTSEQTLSTKKRPTDLYTYDGQQHDSSFSTYFTWIYKSIAYYTMRVNRTDTEVTVYKKNFPIDELSDFSGIMGTGSLPTSADALTLNITAPGYSMTWVASDSKLFMVPGNWNSPYTIPAGATFPIKILDLDTEQLTESTFTNTSGVDLKCVAVLNNPITLDGSGMFFVGTDNKLYVLNTSTGTFTATNLTVNSFYTDRMDISRYTDTLFRYAYEGEFSGIIDPVNLTMYPTNEALSGRAINNRGLSYSYDHDCFIGWSQPPYYDTFALPNYLRLMTINNLSTPVTKDATKTMKVSYTISIV
jgi:hypothetical protein